MPTEDHITQIRLKSAKKFQLKPHPGWLVDPYFPLARMTLLDGKEGIGKGLWCTFLAYTVAMSGGTVLWLTAEDDPEDDVYPRLLALGWDPATCPGNIYFIDAAVYLPAHVDKLQAMVEQISATLVVLDPGRSFLRNPTNQSANHNAEEDVRPGLQALGKMAIATRAAVILVHHWNRGIDRAASDRYSGSAAFAQVARHRVTMAWHASSDVGAVAVTKSNIHTTGHVRSYRVLPVPELNTARFEVGPMHPFLSLDDWWAYVNRPMEIRLEPDEVLEEWLIRHARETDGLVPERDALREATGLSLVKIKSALATLRQQKLIVPEGKRLRWVGMSVSGESDAE